jgi:hypothetical protein
MTEESLRSSLDAALKHLDPNRRQFLGMLLASAAALPLLTSSDLAEAQTTRPYKELGPAHKGSNTQLKSSNQQFRNAGKVDKMSPAYRGSNQQFRNAGKVDKMSPAYRSSSQLKSSGTADKWSKTQYNSSGTAIKSSNTAIKSSNQQLKGSNQQLKNSGSAHQGRIY